MIFSLIFLIIVSLSGLLLYVKKNPSAHILDILMAFGAGSMLAISLAHILPEALETSENAVYGFIAGFVLIYLVEEFFTPHQKDHKHQDHVHEDPHEHQNHVAIVTFAAVSFHTFFDGVGIRASMNLSEATGYMVLVGVAIHQIPVSLSLAAIFRDSNFSIKKQMIMISIFAIMAPIGYLVSSAFLAHTSETIAGIAAAFAGGSLLYIATVDLLPIIHARKNTSKSILLAFLFGVILLTWIRTLDGEYHDHEFHDHIESVE